MDLALVTRIHFIGIGGIGMSALARLFVHDGKTVSGSDRSASAITDALVHEGVQFFSSQIAENITPEIKMVVYTEAMPHDHPEMVAAKNLGVPMMNYFDALALVANEYYLIAVSGTHGKTTTTAMLADIFEAADLDPTVIVGSLRAKTGSNFRPGKSKYAIVEACEYKRDFLSLKPDILVITNIEYEHVDYYKDLADVQSAFRELAMQVLEEGAIIAQVTDPAIAPVLVGTMAKVIDYRPYVDVSRTLRHPGLHTRMNAAAASAVADFVGITVSVRDTALENFAGTWRRFEYKGTYNQSPVYDDYAHHPTEIAATIAGARELYPKHRLCVAFQAHMYTRTKQLFADFTRELARADVVLLAPIYAAREDSIPGVTHNALAQAIAAAGTRTRVGDSIDEVVTFCKEESGPDCVIVVLGAGPITAVASLLTNA